MGTNTKMSWAIIVVTLVLLAIGSAYMATESKKDRYVDGVVVSVVMHDVITSTIKVQDGHETIMLWIDDPSLPGLVQTNWGPFRFLYRGIRFPGLNNLRVVWYRRLPKWKGLE